MSAALPTRGGRRPGGSVGPVLIAGVGSVVLFLAGLFPGYRFELDGYMDAARRCPAPFESEQSWSGPCVARIIAHGPLVLGREFLVASFGLGVAAIGGASRLGRTASTRRVAVAVLVLYLALWAALLVWNEVEADRWATIDGGPYVAAMAARTVGSP